MKMRDYYANFSLRLIDYFVFGEATLALCFSLDPEPRQTAFSHALVVRSVEGKEEEGEVVKVEVEVWEEGTVRRKGRERGGGSSGGGGEDGVGGRGGSGGGSGGGDGGGKMGRRGWICVYKEL